jgi:hypothetical protein
MGLSASYYATTQPPGGRAQIAVEFEMAIDADILKTLIAQELEHVSDTRVVNYIRRLFIEPKAVLRNWDYGKPGEQYPCWTVLRDDDSNTGICYCETGFGPRSPWGLVWLGSDSDKHMSIGMDCGWFGTFMDAYFNSFASTELPIWQVFKTPSSGVREPITDEDFWNATWERIAECRKADPASRYECGHAIIHGR